MEDSLLIMEDLSPTLTNTPNPLEASQDSASNVFTQQDERQSSGNQLAAAHLVKHAPLSSETNISDANFLTPRKYEIAEGTEMRNDEPSLTVFDCPRSAHQRSSNTPERNQQAAKTKHRGGCCQQLRSTMYRVVLLMTRDWCSTLCEFFIPILFVIGTVILWVIFGTESGETVNYFNEKGGEVVTDGLLLLRRSMCINTSRGELFPGISECLESGTVQYYCPTGRGIPAGFCYPTALAAFVHGYGKYGITEQYSTQTSTPPSFDDMVALNWCNLDDASISFNGDSSGALNSGGKLYFAPDTPEVAALVASFSANTVFFDQVYGGTFATVQEAVNFVKDNTAADPPIWGVIQVSSLSADDFDVTIRLNGTALPSTTSPTDKWYIGGLAANGNVMYLLSGFMTLQTMLYNYYFDNILQVSNDFPPLTYTPMPTVEFKTHSFLAYGGQLAPLILVLGFLYPVSQLTKRIVVEKELRIREAMLIMGLSEVIMYVAWLIVYAVWYLVVALIIAIITRATFLPRTSFGYVFFMVLFFAYSVIFLSALIAALFSKARLAALIAPLIYFVLAIPIFAMQNAGSGAKTGVLILSPSALAVGLQLIFEHEMTGGAQASDLRFPGDDPSLLIVFVMLVFDSVIYLILMVYLDLVIPKDWGTTKNPCFCFIDPIRWCFCRNKEDDEDDCEDGRAPDGVFEKVGNDADAAVRVEGLRKKFKRGGKPFLAVNNLYWSMREGEISVLLGHNGAGKSTTMNLMTGMLEADAGDCIIYGKSVRQQLRAARQEIGLCPQHNILWPQLTVREHLEYYAALKGRVGAEREAAVQQLLEAIDFVDKEHYPSKALSGGQKRKLSVAVSFVGGSRLIFLDEPTAGMDVGARRHTWGLLKEMAKHHTILLTTHFMDEADLLGSSVAIMSQGRLQCSGSNMFLKSKLGVGFVLTMSVVAHANRQPIEGVVRAHVPRAEPVGSGAGEVSYRLPMDAKDSFPALLTAVEGGIPSLGINAYSLSATTLEEVFLRIAEGDETEEERAAVDPSAASAVWNVDLMDEGWGLWFTQFRAMIIKRFWNALRDRRTQFFQIVCPVVCVLLAMLLTLIKFWQYPAMTLNSNVYPTRVDIPVANCESYFDMNHPISPNSETIVWSGITTGMGFSTELLATYNTHSQDRYGGIVCDGVDINGDVYSGAFYNTTASHEIAIGTANYYGAYLYKLKGDAVEPMRMQVEGLPLTKQQQALSDAFYSMMIAVIIMIPFSFIPSTFVGWIVKERQCKARHLQNVSGLSFYVYWVANFVFDIACYTITMFLVIAVFGIFNRKEYISGDNIGATIIVFLLYGISGIWMAYMLSFLFSDHSSAQNLVMLANFIVGFLLVLAIGALQMTPSTEEVAKVLRWIFRIVPPYCVGEGIMNMAMLPMYQAFGFDKSPWGMNDGVGWVCVYMAIEIPIFMFVTLFVDHPGRRQRSQRLFHNPDAPPEEVEDADPDVTQERIDVAESPERQSDLVRVQALRKQYSNGKVAVRNVTFGVKPGEVFGFLGTNGAGKTTTISILCQEFYPTSGHASICGFDIVKESTKALRCIGYCPQFDACIDLLTVEEHLYLYASVRGITAKTRGGVVEGLMSLCELSSYRATKSHELSGGNRRKLSVAISLIGGPRVVFLDEPSAGMDPVARRGLWTAIETVADNCSVVLTTHHLEEVEALAHRVAIMVDGTLRCIGDKTRLKQKFGTGFEVTVRVRDDGCVETAKDFFSREFAESSLTEVQSTRLTYALSGDVKLSSVFTRLEENKDAAGIVDYNVSQTSIEQVFLRISEEAERAQEEEERQRAEEKMKSCCHCCGCCV